jgi:hypothetical protein
MTERFDCPSGTLKGPLGVLKGAHREATAAARPLVELREAMAFVNSRRVLLGLCVVAAVLNFFAAPVTILLPRLVQRLGQNAAGFGLLDATVLAICGVAIAAGGLSLYQVRGIREI